MASADRLVRLVMWAAVVAAAWILFAPGKASASENPVQDVIRSATSLTGAVLDVAPQQPSGGSSSGASAHIEAAGPRKAAPQQAAAPVVAVVRSVPKALRPNATGGDRSAPLASVTAPVLKPVAAPTSALEPVVSTTTRTVRTLVDSTVDTVDAAIEPVPVLAPVVRNTTDLLEGVVDALPVVGAEPVAEVPVPDLPPTSGPIPSSPAEPSPEPAVTGVEPVPSGAGHVSDRSLAPSRQVGSAASRTAVAVTAQPAAGSLVGLAATPVPRAVAEASAVSRPSEPTPWPTESPMPVVPVPAQSSASSAGQPLGLDAQADIHLMTSLGVIGSATIAATDMRVPDALNAQPGLRPD